VTRALTAIFLLSATAAMPRADRYLQEIQNWRSLRQERLTAPYGWLSLSGLSWLKQGANQVGFGNGNEVQLPPGFDANAGVFVRTENAVEFRPGRASNVAVNGKPAPAVTRLKTDKTGAPDEIAIGRLRLQVIERGDQMGVRLRDPESTFRKKFAGLRWYPPDPKYAVDARFVPYPKPRVMTFDAQAGGKQQMTSPGYVEFQLNGQKLRLTPVQEGNELFFIFRDRTAGRTTYPAARFLYTEMPKNGTVRLDFNRAYNPPCVFTPYSTCPLPPPENRLGIALEAGEMMPPSGSGH
jgi:uncharacterized protein (DUF1684 family)